MATKVESKSYRYNAEMPYAYIKQAVLLNVDQRFLEVDCDVVIPPSDFLKAEECLVVHLDVERGGSLFKPVILDASNVEDGLTVQMTKYYDYIHVGSKVELSYFLYNADITSLIQPYVVADLSKTDSAREN